MSTNMDGYITRFDNEDILSIIKSLYSKKVS